MKKNSIKYLQKIQLIQLSSIPIKISTVSRNKFKYNLDSQFQNSQTPFNLEITKSLYEIELGLKGLFRNSLKKKKKKNRLPVERPRGWKIRIAYLVRCICSRRGFGGNKTRIRRL